MIQHLFLKNLPPASNASNELGPKKQVCILDLGATICSVQAASVGPCQVALKWVMVSNPRFPIQPKIIGLGCFPGNDGNQPPHFSKKTFDKKHVDSDESERNQSHPSIHGVGVDFYFRVILPVGLEVSQASLGMIGGTSCETGGSRCKRKCWRSLSWL